MNATAPTPTTANVVAVGHFNPAIITPDWLVATGLVEAGPKEIEVAIGDHENVLRHKVQGFVVTATTRRLQIDSPSNNVLGSADLLAKILSLLAHTPLTAVGLNFHFAAEGMTTTSVTNPKLASVVVGVVVEAGSRITQQLPDGRLVQLHLTRDAVRGQLQINLQRTVKDAGSAVEGLRQAAADFEFIRGLAAQVLQSELR